MWSTNLLALKRELDNPKPIKLDQIANQIKLDLIANLRMLWNIFVGFSLI